MIGAVIYARYSSERQNEQSIEGQLRICRQYAEQNGLTILDTYIDRAMTGTNDNRPAFQQMLADCEKPVSWDIVLVYAIDRFGRNSIEIAVNKQRLKKNHKTLISATQRTSENIDGSKNLDGILLENVYIGLAEYYSAELSQKIRRGLHESRSKGLFTGGPIPYGYRVENKRVYIHEEQAKVVLYIFRQYARGVIAKDIIADLTAKGITCHGKPFAINTVYKMLRLNKYIGICTCGGVDYNTIYPAIVPLALFQEVGRILEKNKIGSKSHTSEFLLKGKMVCGYCGKNLQGDSGTSKSGKIKYYYKCMGRKRLHNCQKAILPKEQIEKTVLDAVMKVFGTAEGIDLIADEIMKIHKQRLHDRSLLSLLVNERDNIKKALSNILKAIEQGILNVTTKSRMDELETQLADVDEKIAIEQHKAQTQLRRETVVEFLTHTVRQDPKLLIKNLIQKIVIFDDKCDIYFNYLNDMPSDDSPDDNNREHSLSGCSDVFNFSPPRPKRVNPSNGFAFFFVKLLAVCGYARRNVSPAATLPFILRHGANGCFYRRLMLYLLKRPAGKRLARPGQRLSLRESSLPIVFTKEENGVNLSLDNDTIQQIVEQYSDMVLRIAYQNTHNLHEAEDIMQDVFIALMAQSSFSSAEHIKAWLIRATVNKCRDYLRSARSRELPMQESMLVFSPEEQVIIEEVALLPPMERTIIYLYYYEGYSAKEIADILGKSRNAVYLRLMRAKNRLKHLITEADNEKRI